MKTAMLAAGAGSRLGMGEDAPPKALLRFDGRRCSSAISTFWPTSVCST